MEKIILFMAYYGKLPNYFKIWLKAIEFNNSIDFCIITDCIDESQELPTNVNLLYLSYEDFKFKIQNKFNFKISIKNFGRISQFRPAFAYIFPEVVEGYQYWGFIECDLIPGDIRAFITDDILKTHDKIFKLGHFQIFKNNEKMNTLFMKEFKSALSYKFAFNKNVLFFEELLGMQNIANAAECNTYYENIFSDICSYEYMFNKSVYGYNNSIYAGKCIFEYINGKLFEYERNEKFELQRRETLYVHLQKRRMEVATDDINHYLIIPNTFLSYTNIDKELFINIEKQADLKEIEYKNSMKERFKKDKRERYGQLCWWELALIRYRIRNNGGIDLNGK